MPVPDIHPDGFALEYPKGRELLGGDLLAQSLKALGVTHAFGVHGGHLDAFLVGCDHAGIKLVDTRHETVAVNAADAYSKVSGKVGVCFATANSGFANALPGLASAFADRSSVFCVTSSAPLRDAETNCLQGFHDQVVLAKNTTKLACRVTNVGEIPRLVAYAFRLAKNGAPGPTLLDCPIDVLFSPVYPDQIAWGSITKAPPFLPAPHPDAITAAVAMLRQAKRPVIITGSGALGDKNNDNLLQFVERTRVPTFHSGKATNALPFAHPLNAGPSSGLAGLSAKGATPDLVLLLGARTGMYLGNRGGRVLPAVGCKFIQVDTDGGELGRSQAIDLGIISDYALALQSLIAEVGTATFSPDEAWIGTATAFRRLPNMHESQPLQDTRDGRGHPFHALKALFNSVEKGPIITIDGGECSNWANNTASFSQPSMILSATGYLGFLGNGYGYALGCAIADPTRLVINCQGDGSAGFHIAELDTYLRHNVNVLTVVINNSLWGLSQHGQELLYGSTVAARPTTYLNPSTAYEVVAHGLQVPAVRVVNVADIPAAVAKLAADASGGPSCLNLVISDLPIHPGTQGMVGNTDDPNLIVVPYYDNPPRPFFK